MHGCGVVGISRLFQKRLIESSVLGRVFRARFPLPQARRAASIQSWDVGETSRDLLYSDAAQLWKSRSAPQPKVLQPRNPNNRFSEPFETCCAALVSTFVTALFDNHFFSSKLRAATLEVSESLSTTCTGLGASDCKRPIARGRRKFNQRVAQQRSVVGPFDRHLNWLVDGVYKVQSWPCMVWQMI